VHQVLEDAHIKLSSVASDIFGASGKAMLEAPMAGNFSPEETAELAKCSFFLKSDPFFCAKIDPPCHTDEVSLRPNRLQV
jgi:hypothetical protein